ncbi:DNA adenine methylase [Candidatus Dojkabacteria bacterium]|jgi:tRNA G10  N-methylase Trm11|nr:DNA adenine methylase [Candidatus Dojkabacteria bacterium]
MNYYFLPGRNYELSKAELISLLPEYSKEYNFSEIGKDAFVVKTNDDIKTLFHRLGGFISYGTLIDDLENFLNEYSNNDKVVFGINLIGNGSWNSQKVKELADSIKKSLTQREISAKFVLSNENVLNAVSISRNKILEKGFLLEIMQSGQKVVYGKVVEIQDIEEFSEIEYNKPYTDTTMGVMPAKLSRILVNLTKAKSGQTIWDPFCGSGTILLEALKNGLNVLGSDVNPKSVKMTQANIEWLGEQLENKDLRYKTFRFDVVKPDSRILSLYKKTEINALVCEPFMGPPQHKMLSVFQAKKLLEFVKRLYLSLFSILEHIKLHDFTAVIIVPSYKTNKGWATISINEIVSKKWSIENRKLGGPLQWSRPNSIIRRNIFVLYKKN